MKGFSLLELMLVLALLAILLHLSFPSYVGVRQRMENAVTVSELLAVQGALEACFLVTRDYSGCGDGLRASALNPLEHELAESNYTLRYTQQDNSRCYRWEVTRDALVVYDKAGHRTESGCW